MARKELDAYMSPEWAAEALLERLPSISPHHTILEPCAGEGAIASVFRQHGHDVVTVDIDESRDVDVYADMADPLSWGWLTAGTHFDWIITNPPFNQAHLIVPLALEHARVGVAMLLRLSFLEPTKNREAFLVCYPPQKQIVLPRISFTGDGKTDTVTCAWLVWLKIPAIGHPILVVPRAS